MVRTLAPIIKRANASEHRIENIAGGVLEFWSLVDEQAGRGRKYKRVIVDECAFAPHLLDTWNFAIRPTLLDMGGDAYFFSTPKGRNGFWHLWQNSNNDADWQSWQMPTAINPMIPPSEIDAMRQSLPERVFQQEILAQFVDDAGGVFRRVMDAATAPGDATPQPGQQYIYGLTGESQMTGRSSRSGFCRRYGGDGQIQPNRLPSAARSSGCTCAALASGNHHCRAKTAWASR